ncbi:MAG: methyl-accepting chemotaxis protein [Fibrobacterota bacterium]|nr:methyl-accepting chemotaxis protein [Chitinispirillaceae bacterium]
MSKVNCNKRLAIVIKILFSLLITSCIVLSIIAKSIPYLFVAVGIIALLVAVVYAYKSIESDVTDGNNETQSASTDVSESDQLKVLETHLDNSVRQQLEIIPVLTGQLQAVIDQTDEAANGITGAFIGISSLAKKQFNDVNSLFGNLSSQSSDNNVLFQMQDTLTEIKQNFSVLTSFFNRTLSMISDVVSQLGKVDDFAANIDNIGKITNILALNASIQAAHSGESGLGFKVIASEINALSKNSTKSIHEITGITTNLTTKVNAIKEELESVFKQSNMIEMRTNELFQVTTDKINDTLHEIAEKINAIAADAEHLTKEVSKIVVSIQFQDITRQRIEHVITPLSTIQTDIIGIIDKLINKELSSTTEVSTTSRDELLKQYTMESEREILNKINAK